MATMEQQLKQNAGSVKPFAQRVVRTAKQLAKVHDKATLMTAQGEPWGFAAPYWTAEQKQAHFDRMVAALPLTVVFEPEEA